MTAQVLSKLFVDQAIRSKVLAQGENKVKITGFASIDLQRIFSERAILLRLSFEKRFTSQ